MADNSNANLTAQAKELREGESVSRTVRLSIDELHKVNRKLSGMRNSMNQIASRIREGTDRHYRVESGHFINRDVTAVFLVVVLTCMEDEGEDDI